MVQFVVHLTSKIHWSLYVYLKIVLCIHACLVHLEGALVGQNVVLQGKLIAEQLRLALEMGNESKYLHELADSCCEKCPKLEAQFGDAFKGTIRHVIDVLQKLSSLDNHGSQPEAPSGSITAWESLFKSTIANLGVDTLCEKLLETIHFAVSFLIFLFF